MKMKKLVNYKYESMKFFENPECICLLLENGRGSSHVERTDKRGLSYS